MNDTRMRSALVAGGAFLLGAMISLSVARAADESSATAMVSAGVAQCGKLPLSEREMCIMQAKARFDQMAAPSVMSQSELAALNQAEVRYGDALTACGRLPLSERGTCQSQAQAERSRSVAQAAKVSANGAMLNHEMRSFQAAVAACNRLPLSEREMCKSNAGIPHTTLGSG